MSHRLQVLIPESLNAKVRLAAQRRRVSKGEWVRQAIERSLGGARSGPDPLEKLARLEAPTAGIGRMLREIEAGRK
jgi:hypothetical protein